MRFVDFRLMQDRNNMNHYTVRHVFFISILVATICLLNSSSMSKPAWSSDYNVQIPYQASDPSLKKNFDPESIDIQPGDKITWINNDEMMHTITGHTLSDGSSTNGFDSGALHLGQEFTFIFNQEGEFKYSCMFHPFMTGKIIVSQQG
jgi:plastocyanin